MRFYSMFYAALLVMAAVTLSANHLEPEGAGVLEAVESRMDGGFVVRLSGEAGTYGYLEGSSDLRGWQILKRYPAGLINDEFVDYPTTSRRFYRFRTFTPEPVVEPDPGLEDWSLLQNQVFPAGEGFDTVQFAPDGRLGMIVWVGDKLVYRERSNGKWSEAVVTTSGQSYSPRTFDEHRFQPLSLFYFDSGSVPHIFHLRNSGSVEHWKRQSGQWNRLESLALPSGTAPVLMAGAIGAGDRFHLALATAGGAPHVTYGSNVSGSWRWEKAVQLEGDPRGFLRQSYAPRYFSMAVDANNRAHLTYAPKFELYFSASGAQIRSSLYYASNSSGRWRVEPVIGPRDDSADAGTGASIAIAPDGRPAVASFYNERASTGSSQESKLLLHHRQADGRWVQTLVARSPDGYVAGDWIRGTGFAPYLRYGQDGQAWIVCSDHASQHFHTGQNEYAGQVRLMKFDGRQWTEETIYRQSTPLAAQLIYPAFATRGEQLVVMGLERETVWESDFRNAKSSYRMIYQER